MLEALLESQRTQPTQPTQPTHAQRKRKHHTSDAPARDSAPAPRLLPPPPPPPPHCRPDAPRSRLRPPPAPAASYSPQFAELVRAPVRGSRRPCCGRGSTRWGTCEERIEEERESRTRRDVHSEEERFTHGGKCTHSSTQ